MSNSILSRNTKKLNTGETRFRFDGWDNVDTRLARQINRRPFDIVAWRFADSPHWYDELCEVPAGAAIVVKWAAESEQAELVKAAAHVITELTALEPRLIALERKTAELYELSQAIFNGGHNGRD